MADVHNGGCLCGAVRFEVNGPVREVVYCHCGQCRKQTGLFYAASNAMESDLTVTGGDNVTWYKSSENGRRGFCKHCGSALFWKWQGAPHVSIMAGAFDMPSKLSPGYHIFCEDKGDFYEITDSLPQYPKGTPAS
jgi:hypothetical protein